jgi:CHASE3 domain sensor protein
MTTQPERKSSDVYAFVDRMPGSAWLKNLSIGTKLTFGFGVLVLLTFISAGVSYLGSGQATRRINQVTDTRAPTAIEAANAQANLLRMLADVRGYLALGDQVFQRNYLASAAAFEQNLDTLEGQIYGLDRENIGRLVQLRAKYDQWSPLPKQLFELRDDQLEREPAYKLLATDGIQYAGEVLIATNSLIDNQGEREPTQENLALLANMAKFQGNFAAMLSSLRGYTTTRNRIYRGEFEVNRTDNENTWERLRQQRDALTPEQQVLLDRIAESREAFLALPDDIFAILESERWRLDLYRFRNEALVLADDMQALLQPLTEDQQEQMKTDLDAGRADLRRTNTIILVGGVFALIFGAGMAYVTGGITAGPVVRLTHVAERIRSGDLAAQATVESGDEIGILAATFNKMTAQLRATLLQVRKEKKRADDLLEVVIPIGVELTTEKDFNRLLESMLLEAKAFCHADAGTLYLIDEEEDELQFVIVRNDARGIAQGGTTGNEITYAPLPLDASTAQRNVAVQVARTGESSNVPDHNQPSNIIDDYMVTSLLTIPLKNSEDQVLGVLQLINAEDPESGEPAVFDLNLQQMMESFSSLAVAALEAYIREQALRREIQELRIEIDHAKKEERVAEITESDYFRKLRQRARELRKK